MRFEGSSDDHRQGTDASEMYACRFCLEEGSRLDFIAPCRCAGTSKWVHRACLDQWRSTREDKAFSQCTECHAYYDMVCVTNDTWSEACCRRSRFCAYLTRDLLVLILLSQAVVFFFAGFIYLIDMHGHSLLHLSRMHNATLFYYGAGWFVVLAMIGIIALCFRNQVCESCTRNANDVYCGDLCMPCYVDPVPGCLYCPIDCCTCECAQCTAVSCGEEMLAVLLVAAIILAVIGVFVAVVFGCIILQHVIRRHISVLNKWNLTREYIVKDLAPDAIAIEDLLADAQHRHEQQRYQRGGRNDGDGDGDGDGDNDADLNIVSSVALMLTGRRRRRYIPPTPNDGRRGGADRGDHHPPPVDRYSYHSLRQEHHFHDENHVDDEHRESDGVELTTTIVNNPLGSTTMNRGHDDGWTAASTTGSHRVGRRLPDAEWGHVEEPQRRDDHDEHPEPSAPPLSHLSMAQRSFLERNHLV